MCRCSKVDRATYVRPHVTRMQDTIIRDHKYSNGVYLKNGWIHKSVLDIENAAQAANMVLSNRKSVRDVTPIASIDDLE